MTTVEKPLIIALASQSQIKVDVVSKVLSRQLNGRPFKLVPLSISEIDGQMSKDPSYKLPVQVEQPVNVGGLAMARLRIQKILTYNDKTLSPGAKLQELKFPDHGTGSTLQELKFPDYIIAIENYVVDRLDSSHVNYCSNDDLLYDEAVLIIYSVAESLEHKVLSDRVAMSRVDLWQELKSSSTGNQWGFDRSYGQILNKYDPEVISDNWYLSAGFDRTEVLTEAFERVCLQWLGAQALLKSVNESFVEIPDFPITGVNFLDWGNLFLQPELLSRFIKYLASKYRKRESLDYICGLDSRGYMLGVCLAQELGIGFVAIKKAGKEANPNRLSRSYQKEYGPDSLEMRGDLKPGRVVIIDDILATGSSMLASAEMCREAGHTVIDCLVVRDVPALRAVAKEKLANYPVRVPLGHSFQ